MRRPHGNVFPTSFVQAIICSLSLLFFTVSAIAERKLKLPQTDIAFYTLGSAFLLITILAIGYFRFLGDWFSIFGGGKYILGMTASFLMCAASVRGTVKYRSALYLWTELTCLTLGIFCLIKYTTTTNDYLILYFTIYSWAAAWLSHLAARAACGTAEKYMPFIEHCQNFSIMNLGMLTIAAAATGEALPPALLAAGAFFLLLLKEAFQARKFYCVVYPLAVFATLTFAKSFGAVLLFRSGWTPALLAGTLILWGALSWARLHFPHRLFLYLHPTLLLVLLYGTNQLLQPAWLPENAGLAAAALVSFILYRTYLKARFSSPYADGLFAATALFYSLTGYFHAASPLYLFAPLAALGIYGLLHLAGSSGCFRRKHRDFYGGSVFVSYGISLSIVPWDWPVFWASLAAFSWLTWLSAQKRRSFLLFLQPAALLLIFQHSMHWLPTSAQGSASIAWLSLIAFFVHLKLRRPALRSFCSDPLFTGMCASQCFYIPAATLRCTGSQCCPPQRCCSSLACCICTQPTAHYVNAGSAE